MSKSENQDNNESNELKQIRDALETLNQHKFVRLFNSTPRMLWFQFLRGMAFGVGSVMGATIVVSIIIYIFSYVEFIPIIGDWATAIMAEIQEANEINGAELD